MKGGALGWTLLPWLGATGEEANIYQTYDFRRPALIRRDIQISRQSLNPGVSEFHFGFVRPCSAKHGLVHDSGARADVIHGALPDIRLVLSDPNGKPTEAEGSSHLELAHRLRWEVDLLDMCMDIFVIKNPPGLEDPGLVIPGSFFGHASTAPDEMAWQEVQRLSFRGCEGVFATPDSGVQTATSTFKFRNLKSNIKSTMGDVVNYKERDDNVIGHQMPADVVANNIMFDLTSDMYREAKASGELKLPWSILSKVGKSCYTLRFNYNEALPALSSLIKKVYVPQWGDQLKLEETYKLVNEAARMTGDYRGSDIHLAMRRMVGTRRSHDFALTGSPILFTLDARIPRSGREFEYYDSIGNVSTSHVSARRDEYVIELEPRYPILGTWSFEWTLKYLIPSTLWVDAKSSISQISIPWSATVSGLWSDSVTTEIVLPPRSRVLEIRTPRKATDSIETLTTRRWFDLFTTRPVLRMQWSNVPVLSTHKHVHLAQVDFITDPITSTILHVLWFPTVVLMVFCLVMIQPLILRFFTFLTKLVEGDTADTKSQRAEPSFFEAVIALGDLLRLHFGLSKNDKTRAKAPGSDVYVDKILEALAPTGDETVMRDVRGLAESFKEGAQAELATVERRLISRLGERLED